MVRQPGKIRLTPLLIYMAESNRKTLLLAFGFVGSATSMLFMLIAPPVFVLGALLVVIGITCLGSSFIVLNSFLPILVANDPSVQAIPSKNGDELHSLHSEGDDFSLRWTLPAAALFAREDPEM
jgi:UMF1 family MFS transporter